MCDYQIADKTTQLFEEMIQEEAKSSIEKKRKSDRKSQPIITSHREYFFPKYLTSKNLFELEVI